MLIAFPIGLWIFSFVCDLVYLLGSANDLLWRDMAFYTMAGGVVGALLAAIPGFIDYLTIRDRTVRRVATLHMVLNLVVVAMFIFNLGLRLNAAQSFGILPAAVSFVAILILAVSGWLGGELVFKHRMGINTDTELKDENRRVA